MILDESPQETVERCITALEAVHESADSWRGVVKGGDPDNFCSKTDKLHFCVLRIHLHYKNEPMDVAGLL
jgi:hypothetical protein